VYGLKQSTIDVFPTSIDDGPSQNEAEDHKTPLRFRYARTNESRSRSGSFLICWASGPNKDSSNSGVSSGMTSEN